MESCSCMELALEGERLCRAGDCRAGVQYFEAAVQAGTDDLRTLSVIYSQLGNAYFYLQEYAKALEYHKHDLNLARLDQQGRSCDWKQPFTQLRLSLPSLERSIAAPRLSTDQTDVWSGVNLTASLPPSPNVSLTAERGLAYLTTKFWKLMDISQTLGDKVGEAKASGNLGNTLKVLNKFDEAIACCQRHLDISREIGDKVGEARALYNLGNVYHTKGKHAGRRGQQDPGEFPPEVKDSLQKAAEYYEENLEIVREIGDRAALGRACGNLGNTHYLLGNFQKAIVYHEERLAIAREFGDRSAERRAYTNLGNAHIFLGEFELAAEHYHKTLQIAKQLGDKALEAQACYSLGNTYTLLRDYEKAIEYHLRHLQIAHELRDRVGEGRACWSLGNAYTALNNHEKAMQFALKHLEISKEIGDETGQITAQMNLADLQNVLGISGDSVSDNSECVERNGLSDLELDAEGEKIVQKPYRARRFSMENMELMKLTPESKTENNNTKVVQAGARPKTVKFQRAATVASDITRETDHDHTSSPVVRPKSADIIRKDLKSSPDAPDDEGFFELLSRTQGRRIDDQRCSFRISKNQYPSCPEPIQLETRSSAAVQLEACETKNPNIMSSPGADDFLDMVVGLQSSRMNDQRADLPKFPGLTSSTVIGQYLQKKKDDTVPDDSFFDMLMRCQGSRLEDQRSTLPERRPAPTVPDEDFFSLIQRVQSSRLEEQRTHMPAKVSGMSGKKKKK